MASSKPCHNCRKNRRRCDRSLPYCVKCSTTGQDCLGYGPLFRWTESVASRGRMAGRTSFAPAAKSSDRPGRLGRSEGAPAALESPAAEAGPVQVFELNSALPQSLLDPLVQDLDGPSRYYLMYFDKRFCQDLVVHDSYQQVARNPFRELIPFSRNYPFLHHIIIAASALHFSNATADSRPGAPETVASAKALVHALHARHEAIRGLRGILERHRCQGGGAGQQSDKDAMLATVLFFLNFALVDSGKGGWRAHMQAATRLVIAQISDAPTRTLSHGEDVSGGVAIAKAASFGGAWPELECLEIVQSAPSRGESPELTIRDYVASDSVAYYIWGCTLDSLIIPPPGAQASPYVDLDPARLLPILRRTEANSYHSCPTDLLLNILGTARLARAVSRKAGRRATPEDLEEGLALLKDAEAFDVQSWVTRMCAVSAELGFANAQEVEYRKRIAATYRASACLYVLLAVPGLQAFARSRRPGQNGDAGWASAPTQEGLTAAIQHHLSHIRVDSPLFKYTTWPLFIMGVEIVSPVHRLWIASRLKEMWGLCRWGMIRSAIETLNIVWKLKDESLLEVEGAEAQDGAGAEGSGNAICVRDWRVQLRAMGYDCLIV